MKKDDKLEIRIDKNDKQIYIKDAIDSGFENISSYVRYLLKINSKTKKQ